MSWAQPRLATALAVAVGAMVAAQSRINGELARRIDVGNSTAAGISAALISFGIGMLVLLLALLLVGRLRQGIARIGPAVRAGRLSPWHLLGGAGGAWLVATQGLTVPTLGVAVFIVAVVAGQTVASLGVDAVGLGPAGRVPATGNRVIAAGLALVAVLIMAAPRIQPQTGGRTALLVCLVVAAGAGIAVQQALNARVAAAAEYALAAAVVNFGVGTGLLGLTVLVGTAAAHWQIGPLPTTALLYLGGPIGVAFIAIAAWAVGVVGVLRFALASIGGQLAGGALVDALFPQPGVALGWSIVPGLAVTALAVAIANRRAG